MLTDFVEWCRSRKRELQIDDPTCALLQRLVDAYRAECSSNDEPPQIKLVHSCRSNACDISNTSCALCKNTLFKKCTRLVKYRYRDVEPVQALCKGLITCQLQEVPGRTDQVTHFRVFLVDSGLYDELKSQLGREPRWSELQDPRRRIVIHQTGQATTGIFQRVSSDYFPLSVTRQQGYITADIGGSGQPMVITVSSHKFTQRRKLGHFRLLVVAGCEAPGGSALTDADSAPVLDSILPAVSDPFKVGTAPYVEEPLKMSYPIERLYGIGRNLEGVFHDLRNRAAEWTDTELASKVVACLGPHQVGIETVEEFLQFATRLSAEPPVVDKLKTTLNAARLQEAVDHARQAVYPDHVPRIFTTTTPEGRWGLVYAVEDGALQLEAGPIEYLFQSATDHSRTRFEPRSKEAAARQDQLRDLHSLARSCWFQDGHRNWSAVNTSVPSPPANGAPTGADDAGRPGSSAAWPQPQPQQQQPGGVLQQVSPPGGRGSRGGVRSRSRQAASAAQLPTMSAASPQSSGGYPPQPSMQDYSSGYPGPEASAGVGPGLPGQGSMDEFLNFLDMVSSPPAVVDPPPFMHLGPSSPSWPGASSSAGSPMTHPAALPQSLSGPPREAIDYLTSPTSSPTANSPSNLPPPHSSAPTDLPSLDAGIGPGSPPHPPAFTHPPADTLLTSMPPMFSAPNRIPASGPPRHLHGMVPLSPAASDPHPLNQVSHLPTHPSTHYHHHAIPPPSHQQASLHNFTFTRTITTASHQPLPTFPTASTSPPLATHHFPPQDAPFAPPLVGGPPLPSPWGLQPVPGHGPQLGSTPTQSSLPPAMSPFHDSCPPGTQQSFPPLNDFEPEEEQGLVEKLQNSSLDPHDPNANPQDQSPPTSARNKRRPLDERPGDPNTSTHTMRPAVRHHLAPGTGADAGAGGGAGAGAGIAGQLGVAHVPEPLPGTMPNGSGLVDGGFGPPVLSSSAMFLEALTPSLKMDIVAVPDDSDGE